MATVCMASYERSQHRHPAVQRYQHQPVKSIYQISRAYDDAALQQKGHWFDHVYVSG